MYSICTTNLKKEHISTISVLKCIEKNLSANGEWIIDIIVVDKGFFLDGKFVRVEKFEGGCEFSFKNSTYLLTVVPDKL